MIEQAYCPVGSWDRVLKENSGRWCRMCLSYPPEHKSRVLIHLLVHHWLRATSNLAAQDQHPVQTRKIPKMECHSVHEKKSLECREIRDEWQGTVVGMWELWIQYLPVLLDWTPEPLSLLVISRAMPFNKNEMWVTKTYEFFNFWEAVLKKVWKTGDINSNSIFYLTQYSQSSIIFTWNRYKNC